MYNRNYYSRRGRTIERKKTEVSSVIRPELVNVYYNYLKDNGLIPEPPAPIEDGSYVTYHIDQPFSFPTSFTSLNSALGSLLDTFEVPVDITEVDSIRLEYTFESYGNYSVNHPFNRFSSTADLNGTIRCDSLPLFGRPSDKYTLFFYRTSASTFVVSVNDTINSEYIVPLSSPLSYVSKVDDTGATMVVKSITVSTYANE